jgi:2-polyprenyl-6-methoxyphenol hydroxylase-like FAD-dependent oxidoreductase
MTEKAKRAMEADVLIVGAGPVGLTLALDLGLRGVRCTLIERNATTIQLPKMERCNALPPDAENIAAICTGHA